MIKHTYFRKFMDIATPSQREIAINHFREIYHTYEITTRQYRELWQGRVISMTTFKKVTCEPRKARDRNIREIIQILK